MMFLLFMMLRRRADDRRRWLSVPTATSRALHHSVVQLNVTAFVPPGLTTSSSSIPL